MAKIVPTNKYPLLKRGKKAKKIDNAYSSTGYTTGG
jgi:hypothetical protein